MKQIVALIFTFSGIYAAAAQNAAAGNFLVKANAVLTANRDSIVKRDSVLKRSPSLQILTNPVRNKLLVTVNNFAPGMAQLLILDAKSHVLRNDSRMVYGSIDQLTVMFALPAGLYVVMLKQKDRTASKKFVVQ